MARRYAFAPLTAGDVRRRFDRLCDYLDAWGDLATRDVGASGPRRLLEFAVEAPGRDLPAEVKLLYREYYSRSRRDQWDMAN